MPGSPACRQAGKTQFNSPSANEEFKIKLDKQDKNNDYQTR